MRKDPPNRRLRQLRRIRGERHLTQLQLARGIGRSRALVSLWERGYMPRDDGDVRAVAAALGVSREVLVAPVIELRAGSGFVVITSDRSPNSRAPSEHGGQRRDHA